MLEKHRLSREEKHDMFLQTHEIWKQYSAEERSTFLQQMFASDLAVGYTQTEWLITTSGGMIGRHDPDKNLRTYEVDWHSVESQLDWNALEQKLKEY